MGQPELVKDHHRMALRTDALSHPSGSFLIPLSGHDLNDPPHLFAVRALALNGVPRPTSNPTNHDPEGNHTLRTGAVAILLAREPRGILLRMICTPLCIAGGVDAFSTKTVHITATMGLT
jgi:hypothetical protein